MTHSKLKPLLALAALVLSLSGISSAYGQYQITGATAGGGHIVVGNGLLGSLSSGASNGFLTTTGGDFLTLNLGSYATTTATFYGSTIKFSTPGNTLVNLGTIGGGLGNHNTDGGVGVSFISNNLQFNGELESDTIMIEAVYNYGIIAGSSNNDFEIVGTGVSFLATDDISNVGVLNAGFIYGGTNSYDAFVAGSALSFASEESSVTGVVVYNSGNLVGGNDNDDATVIGSGISILAGNGISNVSITNILGGNILGGNGNISFDDEGSGLGIGNAIVVLDESRDALDVNGLAIGNAGNIVGGNGNFMDEEDFDSGYFLGGGIAIGGEGSVENIQILNASTGNIVGGNDNDEGWFQGTGIAIASVGEEIEGGSVSNVAIYNAGLISGGNGNFGDNEFELEAGTGIAIIGGTAVNSILINNYAGGRIVGGNNNFEADGAAGSGIDITTFGGGIDDSIEFGQTVSNISINNWGTISGGSGNDDAFYVACGIGIDSETILNVTINNGIGGVIAGGNGNSGDSFESGAGIALSANTINGVVINNWWLITGGNDIPSPEVETYGGDGIDIEANNISNVAINNAGIISGGIGGGYGIFIDGGIDPSNVVVNNIGVITGGAGDAVSENTDGGNGIEFDAPNDNTNINIVNFGYILGGNAAPGGRGGEGVVINGNNTVTDNWGVIAVGASSAAPSSPTSTFVTALATPAGESPFPSAIDISGNNNVVNLNGHSAVIGKITASGNNNVVNLNFTGVPAQELFNLNAALQVQGVNSGSDTPSVVFELRGVVYDIDPAMVNGHLLSYQLQALTPNQAAVGASLDSAKVNPAPGTPLFNLYNAIDQSGNVPRALEELSPQSYQIFGDIALANANFTTLQIDERLNNLRDGSEGIDTTGMGGNTMGLTSGLSKNDGKESKGVITPAAPENRWGFFASGDAIFANIDAHGNDLQNANFTTAGMLMGLDGKINEHWLVGTFFDYEHTSADVDSQGGTADVDSYGGGLYAGYHNEGYYGNGLLAYTRNNYSTNRGIFLPGFTQQAGGSTNGDQFEANIDGGYDIHINEALTWGPILGLQYVHLGVDGFNEGGASVASIALGSQDMDSLRARAGLRIDYHKQIAKHWAFATEARAEWQHEFLDDSRSISASFVGTGLTPFSVQTTNPQRDAALVGVGANFTLRDKWTFFFDYDVQAGQSSYLEQSVKGGLKFAW